MNLPGAEKKINKKQEGKRQAFPCVTLRAPRWVSGPSSEPNFPPCSVGNLRPWPLGMSWGVLVCFGRSHGASVG